MMGCAGSTVVSPKPTEMTLECSDGIRLAAQSWRATTGGNHQHSTTTTSTSSPLTVQEELRVLCLHGWMDNCRSFHWLAPALIENLDISVQTEGDNTTTNNTSTSTRRYYQRVHVVALDLPGHGLSSHRSEDAPPMIRAEYLFYIAEAIRQLKWATPQRGAHNNSSNSKSQISFVLIGHSMSAVISLMYAAAFPEQVRQLVLLDSVGHWAPPIQSTSQNLRTFVQSRQLDGPLLSDPANRFYYPSMEVALQARVRSAKSFPGNQYISQEAARQLVQRGVVEDDPIATSSTSTTRRLFRFRHDPRLMWNSLCYLTEDQLDVIYRDVASSCPTCVLLGVDGWPFEEQQRARIQEVLNPTVFKKLPGSHHLHADPDTAEAVAQEIVTFLQLTSS